MPRSVSASLRCWEDLHLRRVLAFDDDPVAPVSHSRYVAQILRSVQVAVFDAVFVQCPATVLASIEAPAFRAVRWFLVIYGLLLAALSGYRRRSFIRRLMAGLIGVFAEVCEHRFSWIKHPAPHFHEFRADAHAPSIGKGAFAYVCLGEVLRGVHGFQCAPQCLERLVVRRFVVAHAMLPFFWLSDPSHWAVVSMAALRLAIGSTPTEQQRFI